MYYSLWEVRLSERLQTIKEERNKISSIRANDIVCVLSLFSGAFSEALRCEISSWPLNYSYKNANWEDYTTILEYFLSLQF